MSNGTQILVVDDDAVVARSIAEFLRQSGFVASEAAGGEQALDTLEQASHSCGEPHGDPYGVLITDISLPGMNGLELIREVRTRHPQIVPIAITGYGTIESAVKAIRLGATDYLTKPLVDEELRIAVEKAIQQHLLRDENRHLRNQLDQRFALDNIVGGDSRMRRIFEVIEAVATSKTTVLMCGESGTGKSLVARSIHRHSPRHDKPYVEISCGSIPETLLESELFGYMKGAFTGAHADKPGRFLAADGGTLFLDEINSASPAMQLKLLRVLQERKFEPVGSNDSTEVDVRVILASNEPLEELVAAGTFRQDLYYRVNVVSIEVPPLRDRVGDIPLLAEHFLAEKATEVGKQITGFSEETMAAMCRYPFPGNVRELENIVERAVVLTRGTRITIEDLPPQVTGEEPSPFAMRPGQGLAMTDDDAYIAMPLRQAMEEPEKRIILAALRSNNWNRQATADELEINRTTLYKKIKQYQLEEMYGQAS